jgi:pimeloyl-ACP methyl ester carboxylesterase
MKRWELAFAAIGIVCILLGARWIRRGELPSQDFVLDEAGCRMPMTTIEPPRDVTPAGTAILIHGLSARRRLMTYLAEDFAGHGFRVYTFDLPGHGDNRDAFNFARAEKCAMVVVESLIRGGSVDPKTTVLVGHSMGAAIAIRMADRVPLPATIAVSPGPLVLPQRMPGNLLVISAGHDIALLKRQAEILQQAAGGNRAQAGDFAQQRAFDLRNFPHATHTSLLFDHNVAHESEIWAMQTVFPSIPRETLALNADLATYETYNQGRRRLAGATLCLIGILLFFPLAATAASQFSRPRQPESEAAGPSPVLLLSEVVSCSLLAVLLLRVGVPLKIFHMLTGDYLASVLVIVGILLLLLNRKACSQNFSFSGAGWFAVALLGLATILAGGAWVNWHLRDSWLIAPRWLRFAGLLPLLWIFAYAEEVTLGPVGRGWHRAFRFGVFLFARLAIWAACVFGAYVLASGQILVVILFVFLAAFSILHRLSTDAIRSRTGSPAAAALFGAILAAWFIAALFPLT